MVPSASLNNLGVKTISAWINVSGLGTGNGMIAVKNPCGNGWYFFVDEDNNYLKYDHCFGSFFPSWTSPANSINPGTWHHVLVIYDRTNSANDPLFYIDGVSQTVMQIAASGGSAGDDSAAVLQIGAWSTGTDSFNGRIDDVRIYNYALNPTQIRTVLNEGAAIRFGPQTGSP